MRTLWSSILALLITSFVATGDAHAQGSATFVDDSPLSLKLTGPFRELGRDPDDRPEHPAVIEFPGPDGEAASLDIEIRIRGNSRVRECRYPPLSLEFQPGTAGGTVFAGQDRLKLVTLCRDSAIYHGYLAQEFLIYRMLNLLTDRSFRVRWATVEYVDSSARRPRPRTAPGFLIEADWEVAERLDMNLIEPERIDADSHDPAHAALLTMFQYLIGNTDWSLTDGPPGEDCCHNGKAIENPEGAIYIVPYDFDNSGLIDAEYAFPSDVLPIRSVRQRLFRGLCQWNGELPEAIGMLNRQRRNLEGVFDSDVIEERARNRALDYLNGSFEIINDPDELEAEIYERCGG